MTIGSTTKQKMKYTFTSLYQCPEISHGHNDDIVIISDSLKEIDVRFTKNADERCLELDTGLACSALLLRGAFGGDRIENFRAELDSEINQIKEARKEKISSGSTLVISITGEEILTINEKLHKEIEEFRVCCDALDKGALKEKHRNFINAMIASISFAWNLDYGFRKVTEGVYFRDENGKLLYSYSLGTGTVTVIVSKSISPDSVDLAKQYLQLTEDPTQLKRVYQLYVQSLDSSQDKFRSFISAWTALEIFVNKTFDQYENDFIKNIKPKNGSIGVDRFVERIKSVMNGKYNLLDKFNLISAYIGKYQEDEIRLFKECKKLRDDISHGIEIDEDSLPVEKLRNLLAAYLIANLHETTSAQNR